MISMRYLWGCVLGACALAGPGTPVWSDTARFTVTTEVINPDLPAFTATIGGMGNGAELMRGSGGFEPSNFRTRLTASRDAQDTVFADPNTLSGWNTWPEGTFDGADIEVLRIVNGTFKTVRRDRVAQGGYHVSAWLPVLPSNRILPADQTRFSISWESFSRRDAPWYYTVRAVDASGNLSPPAPAIAISPPAKPGKVEEKPAFIETKLTDKEAAGLPPPANLSGRISLSRTLLLSWDPVPGARGYAVYRSDLPPERMRGYGIELAGKGEAIRRGDMILLRKEFRAPRREEVATNRIWGAGSVKGTFGSALLPGMPGDSNMPDVSLVDHAPDTPVEDPGQTYLRTELRGGQEMFIGRYNHAGPGNTFYPVLDPEATYRFEIWMRGTGRVTARFGMGGVYASVPGLPVTIRPEQEWRKYIIDFKVPPYSAAKAKSPGQMGIKLIGPGTVDVDNFRIYRTDAGFMDVRPEDRAELARSGMSALRLHMFIKTGRSTYDLAQLTDPAGVGQGTGGNSLPKLLSIIQSLGMEPWIQIEPHFSPEEWTGLVEYLAAPFDPAKDDPKALPWAAKRVAQGHPAPWTDVFDKIYFEVGNETWNTMFAPWVFPKMKDGGTLNWTEYSAGEVYGLYQEHVLSIMRESPWWDRLAPRLEPVLGGWNGSQYGMDALRRSPNSRVLTHAAYIGGWDSGEGPVRPTPDGFASVMAYAPQVMERGARRYHDDVQALSGRQVTLGTYESGPGYALNGLNGEKVSRERAAEQELVMKSAAAGAATLDSFLTRAVAGDRIQNYFTFGRGDTWRSHARQENGNQAYPSWAWLALFNREGLGDLLAVRTDTVPTADLPKVRRRSARDDAPMAAAYATRRGDRLTVIVVSRLAPGHPAGSDGRMSVQIGLPVIAAQRLTRYRQSGDYAAENYTSEQTRIVSDEIGLSADPGTLEIADLPPASAEVYVFDGVTFRE